MTRTDRSNEENGISRRNFLGYVAATATLVAGYGPVWARRADAEPSGLTAQLEELRKELSGELLLPEAEAFETLRSKAWNTRVPERRPDAIVVAKTAEDVQAVVRFAGAQAQRVAVRGGGHSWCAFSLRDGGILLDLSSLAEISIDPEARTAVVGPGVINGTLHQRASEHGLAFPVAHCPSPPLSGYLLNGGFGWNTNRWGPACANVTAVEMVTASGDLVRASSEQHADLFWAARGGGPGFFAAIVRYHLKLHPLPRAVTRSTYTFSLAETEQAGALVDELRPQLPAEVELLMILGAAPPGLDAEAKWVCTVAAFAFSDGEAAARAALEPLDSDPRVGSCLSAEVAVPTTYDDLFGLLLGALPSGHRYVVDTFWTDAPLPEVVEDLPAHYESAKSELATTVLTRWSLAAPTDTALSLVSGTLTLHYTIWKESDADAENFAWHDGAVELFAPHTLGHYIAETDIARSPERAERSFSREAWLRLRKLRAVHDPDGLFIDHFDRPEVP